MTKPNEIPVKPFEFISYWAVKTPDNPAIAFNGSSFTYSRLDERVKELANKFQLPVLLPGDRIGVILSNGIENIAVIAAVQKAGYVPVIINSLSTTAELVQIIARLKIAAMVSDWSDGAHKEITAEIQTSIKSCCLKVIFKAADGFTPVILENISHETPEPCPGDVAIIFHTSGSTGEGKAAAISWEALAHGLRSRRVLIEEKAGQKRLIALSLSFAAGIGHAMPVIFCGKCLFISELPALPDRVLSEIETHGITSISGAPYLFSSMLERGAGTRYRIESLKLALSAGALLQDSTRQKWAANVPHANLMPVYSMSELHMLSFVPRTGESAKKSRCIGTPPDGVSAMIGDEDELFIKPPYKVLGYLDNNTLNNEKIDSDGWFHTGDTATKDEDGDYIFLGNKGDLINFGGQKVSPLEVENCLLSLKGVRAAKVFGVKHELLGNIVAAAVLFQPDIVADENALRGHCLKHLSLFKVPKEFVILEEGDLNGNLKISRPKALEKVRLRLNINE